MFRKSFFTFFVLNEMEQLSFLQDLTCSIISGKIRNFIHVHQAFWINYIITQNGLAYLNKRRGNRGRLLLKFSFAGAKKQGIFKSQKKHFNEKNY